MLPALASDYHWRLDARDRMIALLGAMIAHPLTGLMAAAIWIVNPWVVERAHFVLPDGYLTLFTLLALWLALGRLYAAAAQLQHSAAYSIMLATVFKTQALLSRQLYCCCLC